MKKKANAHFRKLCALLLALCLLAGQATAAWAAEPDISDAAGAAQESADTQQPEAAASQSESEDTPAAGEEETSAGTVQDLSAADAAEDKVSDSTVPVKKKFDYSHIDYKPLGGIGDTWDFRYTGEPIRPKFKLTYLENPETEDTVSSGSASGSAPVELVEDRDYSVTYVGDSGDLTNFGTKTVILTGMGDFEETSLESGFFIIPDKKFITVSPDSITVNVRNWHGTDSEKNTIYAAIVSDADFTNKEELVTGTAVKAGSAVDISTAWITNSSKKAARTAIKPETTYHLFVSDASSFWIDEESLVWSGVVDMGTYTTKKDSGSTVTTEIRDGSEIGFKVQTQKDQSIKLSWAPDKKKGYDYKSYALYSLKKDASDINDDSSWEKLTTAGNGTITKKSFTDKTNIIAQGKNYAKTGIYKLVAYKADGSSDPFLMIASPWLFKTDSSYYKGEQNFTFTAMTNNPRTAYKLQSAIQNKDDVTNGYSDARTCEVVSDALDPLDYPVNNKLTVEAVLASYDKDDCVIGNKYFFRVKSVFRYGNLEVVSAPSNVLSRKVGPSVCEVTDISGLTPQARLEKMDERFFEELIDGGDPQFSGVHADSAGTCWKEGYVSFYYKGDLKDLKQIQLLRKATENGKYSVVKKYTNIAADVKSMDISPEGMTDAMKKFRENLAKYYGTSGSPDYESADSFIKGYAENLYWVKFDNFIPEVSYYYAVQAVSRTGSAAGGIGSGVENTTWYEKVQNLSADNSTFGSIYLSWKHDDCAKEYWVYRSNSRDALRYETKPILKVKCNKNNTVTGEDGLYYNFAIDKTVEKGNSYFYMVRPVYKADKKTYEDFKNWATMTTEPVEPSIESLYVKTVTASNYSIRELQIKWSAAKADSSKMSPDGYRIELYDGGPVSQNMIGTKDVDAKLNASEFKNRTAPIEVPKVGHTYTIKVKPYVYDANGNIDVGDKLDLGGYAAGATKPMPVTNLKASKQTGNSFRNGAKLTFSLNKNDRPYMSSMKYQITTNDGISRIVDFYTGNETFIDDAYLSRGSTRNYTVKVIYIEDGSAYMSSGASVAYSKPNKVKVQSESDHSSIELEPGATGYVYARFYCNDLDNRSTVQDYDDIYSSNDDIVSVREKSIEDGRRVKIKIKAGSKEGTATIKVKGYRYDWDGVSGSIKVTVKKK